MSDDVTKAAPAVVQQRFDLPCASCGAGPAPESASHCWWCGEELVIKSVTDPSIKEDQTGSAEREAGCDSIVSIHDLIAVQLLPEDHRCV